jgi:hypothetical protein
MARGRKSSLRMVLSAEEQQTLEHWQRSTTLGAGWVRRGKIILLLAVGHSHSYGVRGSVQVKPRHDFVYISADVSRPCRIAVSP